MNTRNLRDRPKVLAFWLAKNNRIFEKIATTLGRSYKSVNVQIRRGNPHWNDRVQIADAIATILDIERINEAALFSPMNEDEAVRFITSHQERSN